MTALNIRTALRADHQAIWEILEPVIREGASYPCPRDWNQEQAFAYWFQPGADVFVAEHQGEIMGTYYLRANSGGPAAHIANAGYMVAPAARGKGVARAMAEDSFCRARNQGFLAMQFNLVIATNEAAVHLWQSVGMAIIGRIPQAFQHPQNGLVDALIMHRAL